MEKINDSQNVQLGRVKVRCPHCFKLFSVDFDSIFITHPKFECTSCKSYFMLSKEDCIGLDEVIGILDVQTEPQLAKTTIEEHIADAIRHSLVENVNFEKNSESLNFVEKREDILSSNEPKKSFEETKETLKRPATSSQMSCPKCGSLNEFGSLECHQCKVVIKKFLELKSDPYLAMVPQKLKEIWQMVLTHYEDEDLHHEFIRQCRKSGNLEFAASRYKKILDSKPNEEIATRFRAEIIALTNLKMSPKNSNTSKLSFRLPFATLAMLLSSIVMFVGYLSPEHTNLMGIGAAFLFITTAIRLVFK